MATTLNKNTFLSTYRDDFRDSDHYHRILFNAGRALQARELTQLQTITQREIERFGRNIFKEGGIVNGCEAKINKRVEYIRIQDASGAYDDLDDQATIDAIIGLEFVGQTSGVKFKVRDVIGTHGDDDATLFVSYVDEGTSKSTSTTSVRVTAGEDIQDTGGTYTFAVATGNDAKGNAFAGFGTRLTVNPGDVFAVGHFVFFEGGSIYLEKYSNSADAIVGFKVTQDIVTEADNEALYDNTGVSPNLTSPGAHRYRIRLTLIKQSQINADDTFVYFANIQNSNVVSQVNVDNSFNKIQDIMAKRTKEESGNYIINPFIVNYEQSDSDYALGQFTLNVSSGLAYVDGYRISKSSSQKFAVDIPNEVDTIQTSVPADLGHYVEFTTATFVPNLGTFERLDLTNAANGGGTVIGKCRVRAIEEDNPRSKVYLFDIEMGSGQNFRTVKSITNGTGYINLFTNANGEATLLDVERNNLLFNLPRARPTSQEGADFTNIGLTYQFYYTHTSSTTSTGNVNLSTIFPQNSSGSFSNTSEWVVIDSTTGVISSPTITLSNGAGTNDVFNITGLSNPHTVYIAGYVTTSASQLGYKVKALRNHAFTDSCITTNGVTALPLPRTDIFKLIETRYDSAAGDSTGNLFTLDNGQRDNFYDNGRLILNSGQSVGTKQVFARYQYFEHTGDSNADGAFFSAASYPVGSGTDQIRYGEIPTHITSTGVSVPLRNVLDFRSSVANSDSDFSNVTRIPKPTSVITGSVKYYKSRNDILVLRKDGVIENIQGVDNVEPKFPEIPEGSLPLYRVAMNANTIDDKDMRITRVDAPRYTMKDIDVIRKRVDQIEQSVSLSLLELRTQSIEVLDSADNPRTRLGFFSDAFNNLTLSNTRDPAYSSSINPQTGVMSCPERTYNIDLSWSDSGNSNVVKKGDNLYLRYDHVPYETQLVASRSENLAPFLIPPVTPPESPGFYPFTVSIGGSVCTIDSAGAWIYCDFAEAEPDPVTPPADPVVPSDPPVPEPQNYIGQIRLSPQRDTWRIVEQGKPIITTGNAQLDTDLDLSYLQNEYQFNWTGQGDGTQLTEGQNLGRNVETEEDEGPVVWRGGEQAILITETTTVSNLTITGINTIQRPHPDGDIVQVTVLPWARQRMVFFRATGLAPNTTHYPYLAGKRVDAFCRSEVLASYNVSDIADDNLYLDTKLTTHPRGSNALKTDGEGNLNGTLLIPAPLNSSGGDLNTRTRIRANTPHDFVLVDVQAAEGEQRSVAARSRATASYTSQGHREFHQEHLEQIRVITIGEERTSFVDTGWDEFDPLAQTFFVEEADGIYITKLGVFFRTAPAAGDADQSPVVCQIRPVVNGYPSSEMAFASKTASAATIRAVAGDRTSIDNMRANRFDFEFDEPVYLPGGQSYCFCLIPGTSTAYEVYTARMGDVELGTTDTLITAQAASGVMFKSANSATWEPDQFSDIAYVITRANFAPSGTAILENRRTPTATLSENPISTIIGSARVSVRLKDHGLKPGDTTTIAGLTNGSSYNGLTGYQLNGLKTIDSSDLDYFTFDADSGTATSTGITGGSSMTIERNIVFNKVFPSVDNITPPNTTLSMEGKFVKGYSYGLGGSYSKDATYRAMANRTDLVFANDPYPRVIANRGMETTLSGIYGSGLASSGRSSTIKLNLATANSYVSPLIDLQSANLILVHNYIDQQDSSQSNYNTPITYVNETLPGSGSAAAKHITVPVKLAVAARGIKIFSGVNVQSGSSIQLYYRTANDRNLENVSWTLASPTTSYGPSSSANTFREYEWLIGGDAGLTESFTQYQLKVVLNAENSSKPPVLTDLRTIAVY